MTDRTFKDYVVGTFNIAKALLTGRDVSPERLQKRLEICSECEYVEKQGGTLRCGVCTCKLSEKGLVNLARYEETDSYGCHHHNGSRWKESGV